MTPCTRRPSRALLISCRAFLGLIAALLLASPSLAYAANLVVDASNSPYTFSASAAYDYVSIGENSPGVLNHSANTLTHTGPPAFRIGAGGTYNLSGTGVLSSGGIEQMLAATFNQSGGTNTAASIILNAPGGGGQSQYTLSGGTVSTAILMSGGAAGRGTFNQSGGTNVVNGTLYVGEHEHGIFDIGRGIYNLSGTGALSAPTEYIGYSGDGTFIQSGGTTPSAAPFTSATTAIATARPAAHMY